MSFETLYEIFRGFIPQPLSMKEYQYKLHAGEAAWLLKADKVIEF
jgi:hypothetical protein